MNLLNAARRFAILCAILPACLCFVYTTAHAQTDDLVASVTRMAKIGSCSSPSFSQDGKTIAFISNMSGLPQIWTIPTQGGWPTLTTALDDPVGGVIWSPRGDWLAFLRG